MVYVKCTRGLVSMLAHRMKCRCRQLIDCQLLAELNGVCLRYSKVVDGVGMYIRMCTLMLQKYY